jgi:hypothetical protein
VSAELPTPHLMLDERFITDEPLGLMFVSSGNRMLAHSFLEAR